MESSLLKRLKSFLGKQMTGLLYFSLKRQKYDTDKTFKKYHSVICNIIVIKEILKVHSSKSHTLLV